MIGVQNRARAWLAPDPPDGILYVEDPDDRRIVGYEIAIVFAATLGYDGVTSLISLVDSELRPGPLSSQRAFLNVPQARAGLLDLLAQLAHVGMLLAWGFLGIYLIWRAGCRLAEVGLARFQPARDIGIGLLLTAAIGIPGLGLYFVARELNLDLTVLPSTLTDTWWRIPVLILAAAANAWAEEAMVIAYFISRLRQLGLRENSSLAFAAVLRGSYHLYQGFGGFVGNFVLGCVFGRVWQRTNRLWPLVIAHTLLDTVSFVGFALLVNHLSFLK
jgi:membrane protease YdiL (CAAX protease family)